MHWHHAGAPDRAAPHLRTAALAAAKRQDYSRALRLADLAGVRLADRDPAAVAATADLRLALAGCLSDLGRAPEADQYASAVRGAADVLGDGTLSLRAHVRLNSQALVTKGIGGLEPAVLERAVATLPTGFESARAAYLLGYYHRTTGNDDRAERWLSTADALFAQAGLPHMRGQVLHLLGVVAERRGNRIDARDRFELAAKVKTECGRHMDAAISKIMASVMDFQLGRLEGTIAALERSIEEVRRAGADERAAHASVYLAQVHAALGQFDEAERVLQGALSVLREDRILYGRMEALSTLGDVQASLARYESAQASLREAEQLAVRGQDPSARTLACGLMARTFALEGRTDEARAALTGTLGLLETISTETRESVALLIALACHYDRRLSRELREIKPALERLFASLPGHVSTLLWETCRSALRDSATSDPRRALRALMLENPPGPRRHELLSVSTRLEAEVAGGV
jgi:tetratricopeptide (TPR) repeat protein